VKTKWAEATLETYKGARVIAIRVPVAVLPSALKQNPRDDAYYDVKITDLPGFSVDVVRELNAEAEDGTTPIHELFDRAMAEAIDNGSLACEYPESAQQGGDK
jgi:hypothetical protein